MARIALLGGSFDPPHFGHLNCIKLLLKSGLVDRVWLVPAALHKDKTLHTSSQARREMLELLLKHELAGEDKVELCWLQLENEKQVSTTFDLLQQLNAQHAQHEFYFVIGSDLLPQLETWHRAQELRNKVKFLLIPRPQYRGDLPNAWQIKVLPLADGELSPIASANIREGIKVGKNVTDLCPKSVLAYIKEKGLYL